MAKKPWAGRFVENTAKSAEKYTESISYDKRLWKFDIEGSIAHARMLAKQGIITKKECALIVKGLKEIYREIEGGSFIFKEELEDIHMNIEAALTDKIGDVGGKLHTARSRNDQVALDVRLYLRSETNEILKLLMTLEAKLAEVAERHLGIILPGFTHMQRAQPVLLSHHLMAYAQMLERDRERLSDAMPRINILPLGSCALAGTSLPIDRAYVAEQLGFGTISENSIDAVSDRDAVIEFLSCSSILMMHISRMAEELVLWSSEEFSFIEISDAFTTGSSIMPQKKNPDVAELMRGKAGRVIGNLVTLLVIMKGLPLSYNRDMQEDKEPLFDTCDTVKSTLSVLTEMLDGIVFKGDKMARSAGAAYSTATDVAEYLVRKGMPFRKAHEVTGKIVRYAIDRSKTLAELTYEEYSQHSPLIREDIFNWIDSTASVNAKKSYGGTALVTVKEQIARFRKRLRT
ncbi:MAG TPA: argininosuccinate lyase [Dissulfurispiraceae bacterium]|nr:argininosuccinate lyase [Dissulfurispiraceae bacterium]